MSTTPTYPGVYVHEIPSGVRTITGVSTSVTAFAGTAPRGPIHKATRVYSFSEYERKFGGLSETSEMSYAVRQFFANGGAEAVIIRVALNAAAAHRNLPAAMTPTPDTASAYLRVDAADDGEHGNNIEIRIDHKTARPNSTFNLHTVYADPLHPNEAVVESFTELSMDSDSPRFVERLINGNSELITIRRINLPASYSQGTSESGDLSGSTWGDLVKEHQNVLFIAVDGEEAVKVTIPVPATPFTSLQALATAIEDNLGPDLTGRVDVSQANDRLTITSAATNEQSSVRVFSATNDDAASHLKLGEANGGKELEATSTLRPVPFPTAGTFLSDTVATSPGVPAAGKKFMKIGIDEHEPEDIDFGTATAGSREDLALLIERAIREKHPSRAGYRNFTVTPSGTTKLLLTSGTLGPKSKVVVQQAGTDDMADDALLGPAQDAKPGLAWMLMGGAGAPIGAGQEYGVYIPNGGRKGIYALDGVDFNLMCLPGLSEPGIITDAAKYCTSRRAFLIVDAPEMKDKPEEIDAFVKGPEVPKTDSAAIYYPWIKIADPLKGGKPRKVAPSGTIAGLYARTDSSRGVWKAPAGTDGPLVGVQGTDYLLTDGENGTLNPNGINCIRVFPVYGAVAWGARTLRGANDLASEWKYVPVRRTALYIEESLYRGLKWVVFEPNDEPLWGQIRLNVGAFMHNMFRQGAFQGTSPRDAYFVKCDKETTTQNDINLGVVNIIVGFAPLKPAEFVMVNIQQMAGQIQA